MSPSLVIGLAVAIVATATLSGIFGMAGGMILMGIVAWALPVEAAMMLHGVTQTASNGHRALLNFRHIRWNLLAGYLFGSAIAVAIFIAAAFVPSKAVVFIALGSLPFLARLIPEKFALDILKRGGASACGFMVTVFQLVAGVSGPILDIFYVGSALTRHEIVASKAITQTCGHLIKLAYYGIFVGTLMNGHADLIPWWMYVLAVVLAMAGTTLGKQVLDRMTDANFRKWSQWIIMGVGIVFLIRGVLLL